MKAIQQNSKIVIALIMGLILQACNNNQKTRLESDESNIEMKDSSKYVQEEGDFQAGDSYWCDIIFGLKEVQPLVKKYESIQIRKIESNSDSALFQVQFEDSVRYIPLANFYIFPKDSIVKQLNTLDNSLIQVYPD